MPSCNEYNLLKNEIPKSGKDSFFAIPQNQVSTDSLNNRETTNKLFKVQRLNIWRFTASLQL